MMMMRSEGTRVIPLSKNIGSQLHPHPHRNRRLKMGIKKSSSIAPRGASSSSPSSSSLKKKEFYDDASSEPDVLIVQSKNKRIMYSTTREINVQEVSDLCDKVGWPKRPEEKLKIALENSFLVAQMYVCSSSNNSNNNNKEEEEEEKLIATCRATSDHAFNACLWDIIVDPEYQGQGLGKAIVSHSIRALLARDVANVTLFADKDVVEFYERLGFVTDADGVKGMFLYPNVEGE
jgi:ribosomal protein S18 acetylase RimI-like enzyme